MAKKIKENAEKPKKRHDKSIYERQTRLAIFLMLAVILIIFLVYFLIQESKKFEYKGVEFEKVKEGNLNLYFANLPFSTIAGNTFYLPVYFREDPRKLEKINISTLLGEGLSINKPVALSASTEILNCEDSLLAATTLSLYLGKLGISAIGASSSYGYAKENNLSYVDCTNTDKYTVLMFKEYQESKIMKAGNCYIMDIADCEIMNVTEKFMLGLWASSQGIEI